jgi:hypothetical protein
MFAQVDSLEVGEHVAIDRGVLVYDLKDLQGSGFALRGLLGEDFISGYDVLIDKAHNVICIDNTGAMLKGLKEAKVALTPPAARVAAPPQSHLARPAAHTRITRTRVRNSARP